MRIEEGYLGLEKREAQEFHDTVMDLEQAKGYCQIIKAEASREEPDPKTIKEWASTLEELLGHAQTFVFGHWTALTEDSII